MEKGSERSAILPRWLGVAAPSVADLLFVALLCTLLFSALSMRLLGDAGIGWHIRTGQIILATHRAPRVDSFSSTMGGKPWFAWEWLYDLIVGQLDSTMGLNGVVWLNAVVIAAVFAWTLQWLIRRGVNVLLAVLLVLLAISASMIHFLARPHVMSWLFTLAWFVILERFEQEALGGRSDARRLWALPALMLLWVNLHGGFVVGFVLLGLFWLAALWDWFQNKSARMEEAFQKIAAGKRARDLIVVGVICAAASLVNPYGWKLHRHIYSYLSNRFLMSHIQEFQSPDFHGVAQRCFLFLLLVTVVALAARGRNLRMSGLLVVLFAVYSGLYAARNIPISSLLLVMIAGPLLSPEKSSEGFFGRMAKLQSSLRGHAWPVITVILTFAVAMNGGRIGAATLMEAHFNPNRMPVAAVNYIEAQDLGGPALSTDSWGGYLIYQLYPREKVVVDDRHDLYGAQFFKSYLKMLRLEPGWQDFLEQHEAGCLVLPRDAAITNVLLATTTWKPAYKDELAVVFVRSPGT
jgi:hypothetical protein